jgi:hypothetical protein
MSATKRLALVVASLGVASVVFAAAPSAEHRRATGLNTAGLRLMKAGQTARAAQHFRDAISVEPAYSLAHYNLACASSILRDVPSAMHELQWLADHSDDDDVARARMNKALVDPDLDFVSVLPRLRALLAVPTYSTEHAMAWLAERSGVWSAELPMPDCAQRSYSFQFASDGMLQLTVRESCAGEPARVRTWEGKLTPADNETFDVSVEGWTQWPGKVRLMVSACPGLETAPGSCFTLMTDKADLGPFHRGQPGTSPLSTKKDLAKN